MARLRYNGLTATLGAALTSSATSVTFGAALTHAAGSVPTIASPDYLPLTILDSSGNVSEIVSLTAYTSGATTGTISRAQEGTTGVAHNSGDKVTHGPTVLDVTVGWLLAPIVEATTAATYTTTSATDADVDATNLAITFNAPASGKAVIDLEATADMSGGGAFEWTLRQGTSTVKTMTMGGNQYGRLRASFLLTGLTPSQSYTYKWGFHRLSSGTHNIYTGSSGGVSGNALMRATAS